MSIKSAVKRSLQTSIRPVCHHLCEFNRLAPPGHFYSPIPNQENFQATYAAGDSEQVEDDELESRNNSDAGIDFNEDGQLELLAELAPIYRSRPKFPVDKQDDFRFFQNNYYYSYADSTVFFCLVSHVRPRRIVDIGGGRTTTLMLDMNEICFADDPMQITLIEPYPDRVKPYLDNEAALDKRYCKVQDVDLELFRSLEPNDVLFLDTTHVSKLGSDVNYLAFDILPVLKPGVIVHIHEVFYPFEYPASFYKSGKYWNEIYLWRAFLMHNHDYKILLFNSWLAKKHRPLMEKVMPDYFIRGRSKVNVQNEGCSLWLRKL